MDQSTPGPPVFHCLPEFGQIHVGGFNDTVQPSPLLSSSSPPAFTFSFTSSGSFPGSLLMRWPKYWSLSFRICPSSEHSGLISFRMDRFVLAVQANSVKKIQSIWCDLFLKDPHLLHYFQSTHGFTILRTDHYRTVNL